MHEHFPLWSFLGWALNAVLELWVIYIWWQNRKHFRLTVLFPALRHFSPCLRCYLLHRPQVFSWHICLLALLLVDAGRRNGTARPAGDSDIERCAFGDPDTDFALEHVLRVLPDGDFCSGNAHRNDTRDAADDHHLGSAVRNCSRDCRVLALHLVARCQRLQRAILRASVFHVLRHRAFPG